MSMQDELAKKFIPLCEPYLGGNEWKYVKDCLDTGWVSSVGSYVNEFESMVADYSNCSHGVACVNGTSALHVALRVAGVQQDDEVILSNLTFIAPANAIRYAGAWPVFIDAEPHHWQMDVAAVESFLLHFCEKREKGLYNRITGRRVSAIVPVHALGHPVDMPRLMTLAAEFDLTVIEDATESLGASIGAKAAGGMGDIGCFSFNGNKLLTTGGGGMLVTNNAEFARAARHLTTQSKLPGEEFIHDEVGYNYRLTNVQAAIGCAQMERIEHHLMRKKHIRERYVTELADHPEVTQQVTAEGVTNANWLFTLRLRSLSGEALARRALVELNKLKIQTRPLWQPMHLSPAHQGIPGRDSFPVSQSLYEDALSLPCSVGLSDHQQNDVIQALSDFLVKQR